MQPPGPPCGVQLDVSSALVALSAPQAGASGLCEIGYEPGRWWAVGKAWLANPATSFDTIAGFGSPLTGWGERLERLREGRVVEILERLERRSGTGGCRVYRVPCMCACVCVDLVDVVCGVLDCIWADVE